MGSAAFRMSRSSPRMNSRFTSRPMTKKKIAMSPSLTQCLSECVISKSPTEMPSGVFQKAK